MHLERHDSMTSYSWLNESCFKCRSSNLFQPWWNADPHFFFNHGGTNQYHAFDEIAKRRRIFKVETVGDCYVAVAGLPDPRSDHAVAMARFAHEIREKMRVLTKELETTLGPDTGDLSSKWQQQPGRLCQ